MSDYSSLITILIGLLAVIIFAIDLHLRRKIQKDDIEMRTKLQNDDLSFRKDQFNEELKEHEQRRKWLDNEIKRISEVSDLIADNLAKKLKDDVKWAAEALDKAKLSLGSHTIFGDRLGHFREEKEFLAEQFAPLLLKRCEALIKKGNTVYLIIDSGTTLYPFFKKLGELSTEYRKNKEQWLDNLKIVTNNLSGMEILMEKGLMNPLDRFSTLAIKSYLLPGEPLPIYSAITGTATNEDLEKLKRTIDEDSKFIGLVTGNWIRFRRTEPICPLPLARGKGHIEFKQALINCSDEVYVITPLCKIRPISNTKSGLSRTRNPMEVEQQIRK